MRGLKPPPQPHSLCGPWSSWILITVSWDLSWFGYLYSRCRSNTKQVFIESSVSFPFSFLLSVLYFGLGCRQFRLVHIYLYLYIYTYYIYIYIYIYISTSFVTGYGDIIEIAAFIFWADGCLCILFAFLTHFKYTRLVKVIHFNSAQCTY